MSFLTKFLRKKSGDKISLEECVEQGLLTKEEMLRIRKDRAIEEWEKESGLKERKTKR
jgi:hypothetical protein